LSYSHVQRIECIVLATSCTRSIAEADKIDLIDLLQDEYQRLLNDLVFRRRHPKQSLPSVRFVDPLTLNRLWPGGLSPPDLAPASPDALDVPTYSKQGDFYSS
jgi:hypothetical protein